MKFANVAGRVIFTQQGNVVRVQARLCGVGLIPNTHNAMHSTYYCILTCIVHEYGDLNNFPLRTGDHFNPFNKPHGIPPNRMYYLYCAHFV